MPVNLKFTALVTYIYGAFKVNKKINADNNLQ